LYPSYSASRLSPSRSCAVAIIKTPCPDRIRLGPGAAT
jgi:hypothetical protein